VGGVIRGRETLLPSRELQLAEGDKVVICGKVVYYKGSTPETAQGKAYVVSINGTGGGDTPAPSTETIGTKDAPLTIAQAIEKINALGDGKESDLNAYVKGKVVKVTTSQANFEKYGNLNYLISEDGTENNTITVYSGDGLDGAKFTAITDLAAGDEVVVFGNLYKYVKNDNVTPEIDKGNYLVKLTKASGGDTPGGGDTPSGSNLLSNGDFETWTQTDYPDNWKTTTSAGNATLSKSTDSHGGTAAVMLAGDAKNNKRLGYKEITLKAGTYSTKFYAKCAETDKTCSVACGYASVGADSKLT
jgi:hypothetical protein